MAIWPNPTSHQVIDVMYYKIWPNVHQNLTLVEFFFLFNFGNMPKFNIRNGTSHEFMFLRYKEVSKNL